MSDEAQRLVVLALETLRPKIRPVAPASMDCLAFSSIAASPARSPPDISSSVRSADLTAASIACCGLRSAWYCHTRAASGAPG